MKENNNLNMTKFLIGRKPTIDAIKQNKVKEVYLLRPIPEIVHLCRSNNIKIVFKEKKFFENYSNHQWCLSFLINKIKIYTDFELFFQTIKDNEKKIILMLDSIHDFGNFGSILRSCKAFGVSHIIFKKNNQIQITEKVIKASVGTIESIIFLKTPNLSNIIENLKKKNFWVFASCLEKDSIYIEENNFNINNILLIIGNENKGISENLLKKSDYKIKIKMFSDIDSLNVSVATGILLHYFQNN